MSDDTPTEEIPIHLGTSADTLSEQEAQEIIDAVAEIKSHLIILDAR